MLDELTRAALKNGISQAIASPELEMNRAVQSMWRNYDTRVHRRRRCFIKHLNNTHIESNTSE